MNPSPLQLPYVWPDGRRLAGCPGPTPEFDTLLAESQLVLGVIHGVTEAAVKRLQQILTSNQMLSHAGNGQPAPSSTEKKVRLIVTLYPTCVTTSDVLLKLFHLQASRAELEVRIATCELLSGPESTLACYETRATLPTVLIGSFATLESFSDDPSHLTLAFTPEPILAAEWLTWFDVRWLKAAPLTEARARIPLLVLPQGTEEAAREWQSYERLCNEDQPGEESVEVVVDSTTGEVRAETADGTPVEAISSAHQLPRVTPVYRQLAKLLDKGHLVSVDKTTRLLPFEVSVKPKWFGLETLKQIGTVRRQVSYHISALTEDELKQLENRRKKTSELLDLFSFSLADGQRWMPLSAEALFRQENKRINTEAAGILSKLIAGDLDKFMAARRPAVRDDANRMYRDLFPGSNLSDEALDEIMAALRKRFEEAQQRSFLPQLSFNRVSLPQPQAAAWKSQLGSALHLLLSIVHYPRKACRNGTYFARGMAAKPPDILQAMNVLNDPFVEIFDHYEARERADIELESVAAVETSDLTAEEKCEKLFELLGHKIARPVEQPTPHEEAKRPDRQPPAKTRLTLFDIEGEE